MISLMGVAQTRMTAITNLSKDNEKDIKKRLKEFKKTLEQNEVLDKFNRYVFENIVEKVKEEIK